MLINAQTLKKGEKTPFPTGFCYKTINSRDFPCKNGSTDDDRHGGLATCDALVDPHDGEGGDEIGEGQGLFHEIEQAAKSTLPAAERAEEDECGDRRPDQVPNSPMPGMRKVAMPMRSISRQKISEGLFLFMSGSVSIVIIDDKTVPGVACRSRQGFHQ